jgi:glutamate/tyrosine decarboxylase-like PLP-dependent enzyme
MAAGDPQRLPQPFLCSSNAMASRVLSRARDLAETFLETVDDRPVFPQAAFADLTAALGDGPLHDEPLDPVSVIDQLASAVERGLVASQGPRYFGFVTGGSVPAAIAADWLTSAWDQNTGLYVMSPAAAAVEHVVARWLLDILDLPPQSSVGFVTGATMANVTALAAARHEVLRRVGWDVEAHGLQGAPRVTVIAGAGSHVSIRGATRLLGLGASTVVAVEADAQGRLRPEALRAALADVSGPAIVCAQAGNVNTGAFDPFAAIAPLVAARGAWLHVDGAFGLWAAASRSLRHLVSALAEADSWTIDAHKWLNVPYDSGFAVVKHAAAHRAAMSQTAAYLTRAPEEQRDGMDWTPESSRRARAMPVYAALRALGRRGVEEMIDRACHCARRMARGLEAEPGVEVLNDVVLNQVLVRFRDGAGTNITPAVITAVQGEGTCWAGGTSWNGEPALRISVSGWKTTEADIDRSLASIIGVHESLR